MMNFIAGSVGIAVALMLARQLWDSDLARYRSLTMALLLWFFVIANVAVAAWNYWLAFA